MTPFVPGQRWLSETQSELGLGLVTAIEGRQVSILFPATGETRLYAQNNAPLSRVLFQPGERVRVPGGEDLRVVAVEEEAGIFTYQCEDTEGHPSRLTETRIDPALPINRPRQRLLAARLDRDAWFSLRYETWLRGMAAAGSEVLGLVGPRVSPIPHQLYIATEVARRPAPRVLLADEVGLGKTIEAGLILHQLLLAGRVARALILVPEPLLHQWLVEMRRRFNLRFALFDRQRLGEIATTSDNPFLTEPQALCPLEGLLAAPAAARAVLEADWDLLILDEAHHLRWSPTETSLAYDLVATLAAQTPGVLLLTATPEQLGHAGHFGRLRLLDPHRWRDYDAFLAEEASYVGIAQLAGRLLDGQPLAPADQEGLRALGLDTLPPERIIATLLDRHGTSRVLFRNSRAAIPGFPAREPIPHPLPEEPETGIASPIPGARPEPEPEPPPRAPAAAEPLTGARVTWLAATLRQLRPEKLIVICAQAATAIALRRALLEREGIHAALFHEDMEIVERDRAAAFFADAEEGAQTLICSEIGGEGRNFQFAHHLVLFDLPLNPDLLEQRIGRLDRIGQTQTIRIHIPYRMGGPEEILYRWYQEGLDAFAAICPAAGAVYDRLGERLRALLAMPQADPAQVDALIAAARRERERIGAELAAGRDRLLELHSHHPEVSSALVDAITVQDADPALRDYLTRVWDSFGIDLEPGVGATLVLRPGVHRLQERFPELPEEGLTVTFDRALALAREDREFLTWEHPMTRGAMAMILDSDLGTCALTILRDPDLPTGDLLLEMIHVAQCPAPPELEIGRFLPPTALRLLLDAEGRDRAEDFPHQRLRGQCLTRNRRLAHAIIKAKTTTLETMIEAGELQANEAAAALEVAARARMTGELDAEIARLRALARVNPNIRAEEITALEERRDRLSRYLTRVRLHLDALRLVVAA
jgi:ATP-dependent helicase HepA